MWNANRDFWSVPSKIKNFKIKLLPSPHSQSLENVDVNIFVRASKLFLDVSSDENPKRANMQSAKENFVFSLFYEVFIPSML